MKVLVTGATGFLGTALCRALDQKKIPTTALVRPESSIDELKKLSHIRFHTGDVTDLNSVREAACGAEVVFHLAGVVSYSRRDLPLMEQVNVKGTACVVEICRQKKIRLIHTSSIVAVGASLKPVVLNEDSPYNMAKYRIAYFDTKRKAEVLVQQAVRKGHISAVILNPSQVYGPGDMKKSSRSVQKKVATGRCPFYTFGGVSVVDVHSVVKAFLTAVDKGRSGHRYILSGENLSVKELLSLVARAGGAKAPFIPVPNTVIHTLMGLQKILKSLGWKKDIDTLRMACFYHWFSNKKAREELGFVPQSARQAVESSVHWWKAHQQN